MKLRLDQKTLDALDKSIQHWQNYADGKGEKECYPVVSNCALCAIFYDADCRGCPIKETTGVFRCANSPYREAIENLRENQGQHDYLRPEFLLAAKKELDFLIEIKNNSELKA